LVVDDAVVVRRLLVDALTAEVDIEVAGTAPNGRIALAKLDQVNPDIVTLDIEMPEMDGLECLAEIKRRRPNLPVIMFSTLTERGAIATLDALARGASDYVTKPTGAGSVTAAMERVRADLVPKIRGLCGRFARPGEAPPTSQAGRRLPHPSGPADGGAVAGAGVVAAGAAGALAPGAPGATHPAWLRARADVVAIGVSTGGPNALATLVAALPPSLPVPVLIVQHMPPLFTRLLAERLQSKTKLQVSEARSGVEVKPGQVWLAPGDHHLVALREGTSVWLRTNQDAPEHSCRPAVDVLFRSVAACYQQHVLGVVMTGMGQDGLRGAEVIREAGGSVFAQDEATSVVWGMPGLVAKAGLADRVLPLESIAGEIVARLRDGRVAWASSAGR
jgi:two-component system chemotaxis response regulator CheB